MSVFINVSVPQNLSLCGLITTPFVLDCMSDWMQATGIFVGVIVSSLVLKTSNMSYEMFCLFTFKI